MSHATRDGVAGEPRPPRPRHTPMDLIRSRRRSLTLGAALVALIGVFAVGVQIGGRNDARTMPLPVDPIDRPFRLANAALSPAVSCDALLDSYQERALALVGPWGWQGNGWYAQELSADMEVSSRAPMAAGQSRSTTQEATSSETGTNVQEAGVDEPDTVKTDGTTLYRLRDHRLTTYDVSGARPEELASISLPQLRQGELLLVEDRLVAVGQSTTLRGAGGEPGTRVLTLNVSDPAAPAVIDELSLTATVVTARLHDGVVRVVTRNDLPELDFVHPDGDRGERGARLHNEKLVRDTTLADWLPQADGESVVECDAVAVPEDPDAAPGTVTTLALSPTEETEPRAVAVATSTDIAYFSSDRLYLATMPQWPVFMPRLGEGTDSSPIAPGRAGRSSLYAFELDGDETAFVAAGEVDGAIADRWSMDSVDGVLRVALGATEATGNFNSVVTLAEDDGVLVERGRVDKLGIDEEIKSVRWFDDVALVVTFRQTDPLYAVDLADPRRPRLLGELKIPGFSQYLHPLGPRRMIGIGQDADSEGTTRGAQAALFNVRNLADLERLDVFTYPRETEAGAAQDPRQFTWLPERRTALTVISRGWEGRTGWVSALRVEGGRLRETRTEVEYGNDIAEVRLVPLPSGKVVLVTGDGVSFFDVA